MSRKKEIWKTSAWTFENTLKAAGVGGLLLANCAPPELARCADRRGLSREDRLSCTLRAGHNGVHFCADQIWGS